MKFLLLISAVFCIVAVHYIVTVSSEACANTGLNCTHVICGNTTEVSCIDNTCTCRDTTPGQYCSHNDQCHVFFGKEQCHRHGHHWVCNLLDKRCHCYQGNHDGGVGG